MIETEKIGEMRYATDSASAVNLYSTGTASGLTLGQLVMAVCLNTAASYEKQSVNKMNTITKNSELLQTGSDWIEKVVEDNASWSRLKKFLVNELGVASSSLPEKIRSYDDRLKVISLMSERMNAIMQTQQQDMVAMQSYVSRRDTAFSSSANIVRALGRSMNGCASNF
jgi:hypothetical protein